MSQKCGVLLLVALFVPLCSSFLIFQDRLPNGNFVPHPCMPNKIWKGVGHESPHGAGKRNAFGEDFAQNGFKWDECLCERDSDGDGLTNGQELGDPDCVWSQGLPPTHKFGLSHPGVCEPLNSAVCLDNNDAFDVLCDPPSTFECDAINSPDVRNMTLRYPESPVPPQETTYVCMSFNVPSDQEYHMIGFTAHIDNEHVMHHMIVTGCRDHPDIPFLDHPQDCGSLMDLCPENIGIWAVGVDGFCYPDEFGFAIGDKGYKTIVIQSHWTNPLARTDFTDSSGIVIYYTPILRDNTAGILQTGQYYLQIPPGERQVPEDGVCSAECSSSLPQPIHIAQVVLHMHYLGHAGYTELWRNGTKIQDLVSTDDYDYDKPDSVTHFTPVEMYPGDVLKTRCVFNSRNRADMTFWGFSSYQEMCITFLVYYPASDLVTCASFSNADICSFSEDGMDDDDDEMLTEIPADLHSTTTKTTPTSVSMATNDSQEEPDIAVHQLCREVYSDPDVYTKMNRIVQTCDGMGARCLPGCAESVAALKEGACFRGAAGLVWERNISRSIPTMQDFRHKIHSCDTYELIDQIENDTKQPDDGDDDDENGGPGRDRYDPDINGLPLGGQCPFGSTSTGTSGGNPQFLVYDYALVTISLFCFHM